MRALLLLAAAACALAALPTAAAVDPVEVRCDQDDDLYQHCNVAFVHWVTGPWCAGVDIEGRPAECREIVRPE